MPFATLVFKKPPEFHQDYRRRLGKSRKHKKSLAPGRSQAKEILDVLDLLQEEELEVEEADFLLLPVFFLADFVAPPDADFARLLPAL